MAITLGRFITLRFILIAFKSKNIKNQTIKINKRLNSLVF